MREDVDMLAPPAPSSLQLLARRRIRVLEAQRTQAFEQCRGIVLAERQRRGLITAGSLLVRSPAEHHGAKVLPDMGTVALELVVQ